jgi:peptidoglycan-associated lipoprotein
MKRGSIARFAMIAVSIGMLSLVGCASKQQQAPAPDTGSEWTEAPQPEESATKPVRDTDVELETIYFDFDRFDIRADARPVLRTNAARISDISGSVTVEGHCDERGSAEYNLALGERRANAVKRYLVDLGVSSSKLGATTAAPTSPPANSCRP